MNVFELLAVLSIDTTGFLNGLGDAGKSALQFGTVAGKIAGTVLDGFAQVTDAVVDFGKQSVDTGMTFDTSMSQVAATMGKTVSELDNEVGHAETSFGSFNGTLREFAQFMGANTAFSASQAADALNYMALAGYNTQQSMDMLPNVLSLAAAGGIDLARASDMVTDAQTALGLTFAETNVMVDQMAKTASTTNTSVAQLGDAILTIGGTAQFMAGGTEELTAVLGVLADNGIKGSEAGTHLRNMLLKLSSPTKEGADAIESLGLQVYDAEGKMRSFEDIFTDLNVAMAGFTEEQKVQTFSDLFNTRDVASATALLNTSSDRWAEVKSAIDDAQGSAAKMADTQLDNLNGSITIFRSALEGLQIVLSDQLSPALKEFVDFGTGGLQAITTGFQEDGLAGAISNAIEYIIDDLPSLIEKVTSEATSLMGKIYDKLPAVLQEGLPKLAEFAKTSVTKFLEFLIEYMDEFPEMMKNSMDFYTEFIPLIIDLATQLISGFADVMANSYAIIWPASFELMTVLINAILANLPELIDAAITIMLGFTEGMIASMPQIVNAIIQIAAQIVATIIELVPTLLKLVVEIIVGLLTTIVTTALEFVTGDYWKKMLTGIVDTFKNVDWKGLGTMLTQGIADGIKAGFTKVKDAVTDVANGIKEKFAEIFDIHSPSKLFKYYGEMMMAGLDVGLEDGSSDVDTTMAGLSKNIVGSFNVSGAGGIGGDIVIPVSIGNEHIQTLVVDALNIANYRSGGR